MPVRNDDALEDRLSRYREIEITVTGRKIRTRHLNSGLVRV